MPTCPAGHTSADQDYCDVCGREMAASPSVSVPAKPAPSGGPCPACGAPLDGRFCEACGHDSLAAPPPGAQIHTAPPAAPAPPTPAPAAPAPAAPPTAAPVLWTATVSADRAYYNSVMAMGGPDADAIAFPQFCPDRYFPLRGNQISIGRRSSSRGINPDIDLTGPPEDPGVSHLHAVFIVQPDGNLSIVDLGSSNGTTINDDQSPLRANVPHPLSTGDQVHLGAWTTITVQSDR
jgi:FHA domain-containing protein